MLRGCVDRVCVCVERMCVNMRAESMCVNRRIERVY